MDIGLPTRVRAEYGCEHDQVVPFDGGLVNYSFAVGDPTRLVIQGINDRYLNDPQQVMENLVRIVGHLEWQNATAMAGTPRWFPTLVPTQSGRPYTIDGHGRVWRALRYIDASPVPAGADWSTLLEAAALFGRFIAALDDFGGPPLGVVVPAFRSTSRILEDFAEAAQAATVHPEGFEALHQRALRLTDCLVDEDVTGEAALHRRVVHNDTKLANCLMDRSGAAVAVIDFDLAMSGYAMDDFGDLVRSVAHYRSADDPLEVAERTAGGFVAGTNGVLSEWEVASLVHGPLRVCVQLAWRYLSDALRPVPLLRVGGAGAALAKAGTNLDVAERLAGKQADLGAAIQRAAEAI